MDLSIIPGHLEGLTQLAEAWKLAQDTSTLQIVLLEGTSGLYKTNLVEQFLETSQANAIISRGLAIPEPYLPLRQAYDSILQLAPVQHQLSLPTEEVVSEWRVALTMLAAAIPLLQPVTGSRWEQLAKWQPASWGRTASAESADVSEATDKPLGLPELFSLLLGDLTAIAPLVFFLDDLDLADLSTIEALSQSILPALHRSPLLFVAAFETKQAEFLPLLDEFTENLRKFSEPRSVTLAPLDIAAIRVLLEEELTTVPTEIQPLLASQIFQSTQGNLAQMRHLLSWLEQQPGYPTSLPKVLPPYSELVHHQFNTLTDLEQSILRVAAIQGRYFCLPAIAHVLGQDAQEVASLLTDPPQLSGIRQWISFATESHLNSRQVPWYQFKSRRHQAWVHQSACSENHAISHQKIAHALEHVYGSEAQNIAGLLAMQFEEGCEYGKAAFYQAIIAQRANDQGELDEGYRYAQRGLQNLERASDFAEAEIVKCQLLIEKGRGIQTTEQSYNALDILKEAYALAERINKPALRVSGGFHLGIALLKRFRWHESQPIIIQVLKEAVEQKNWSIIRGMEGFRDQYYKCGQSEAFLELCNEVLTKISDTGSDEARITIAEILEDKSWIHHMRREGEETLELLQSAFGYLEAVEYIDKYAEIFYKLHKCRSLEFRRTANYEQSILEIDKAIKWADRSHLLRNQSISRMHKAKTLQHAGDIHGAEEEFKAALHLMRRSSDLDTIGELENEYGIFLSQTGRKKLAREMYQSAHEHRSTINNFNGLQSSMNNIAAIDKYLGNFDSALTVYHQLLNEGIAQDNKSRASISLNHLGDIYRILNQINNALQAHSRAIILCDEQSNPARKSLTLQYIGQAHLVEGSIEQAKEAFDQAEVLFQADATFNKNHDRYNKIYLGRIEMLQGNIDKSVSQLNETVEELKKVRNLLWVGIGNLNLALTHLLVSNAKEALPIAERALEALAATESWRVSEAYHLLARCHLVLGDFATAKHEIEQAKAGFARLKLYHRVHQAENTELRIEMAERSKNPKEKHELTYDELLTDFNHLGI